LEVNAPFFETRENLRKFDPKSDEGIFLGYSKKRTKIVMESINVVIDDEEVGSPSKGEKTQSFPNLWITISLAPSGSSRTNQMSMVQ